MVRISVPTIPQSTLSSSLAAAANAISPKQATERIADFLGGGNVTVITGAGVSVDSGIRAYRGAKGRYLNPNYQPIFYHELMDESEKGFAYRQRYWTPKILFADKPSYQPVRDALPNPTHYALAALQYKSIVPQLITQNVDGLHHKALSHVWDQEQLKQHILELHGSLHNVHCKFGHVVDRDTFQDWLSIANPQWKEFMDNMEKTGQKPRTNPDGDVVLEGARYDDFVVPPCPKCREEGRDNNTQKPELIFFGESIKPEVRQRSYKDIETADRLFLVGTTLATFSAFRLLKHALELKKPVLYLNVGPTRADGLPGIEKIEIPSGLIMRDVVKAVLATDSVYDPVVGEMLRSGVVKPPPDDAPDS